VIAAQCSGAAYNALPLAIIADLRRQARRSLDDGAGRLQYFFAVNMNVQVSVHVEHTQRLSKHPAASEIILSRISQVTSDK